MKKTVLLMSIGLCALAAQADYLLWTVNADDIDEFLDNNSGLSVASARFGRVANGYTTLYVQGESVASLDTWGETITAPIQVSAEAGEGRDNDAFLVDVSSMGGSAYSYYIELLNSSGQVVGRTVNNKSYFTYDQVRSYISTGTLDDVPAAAVVWHGSGFQAVPEPSSMALLALGAGLVGLRRKLKKGKKEKRA